MASRREEDNLWMHSLGPAEYVQKVRLQQDAKHLGEEIHNIVRRILEAYFQVPDPIPLTEDQPNVKELLSVIEQILNHGMRTKVERLRLQAPAISPWNFLEALDKIPGATVHDRDFLTKMRTLKAVKNPVGKTRAFIRHALNVHFLEEHLAVLAANSQLTGTWYEEEAFMNTPEQVSFLRPLLAGLNALEFRLSVDDEKLDIVQQDEFHGHEEIQVERKKKKTTKKKKGGTVDNLAPSLSKSTSSADQHSTTALSSLPVSTATSPEPSPPLSRSPVSASSSTGPSLSSSPSIGPTATADTLLSGPPRPQNSPADVNTHPISGTPAASLNANSTTSAPSSVSTSSIAGSAPVPSLSLLVPASVASSPPFAPVIKEITVLSSSPVYASSPPLETVPKAAPKSDTNGPISQASSVSPIPPHTSSPIAPHASSPRAVASVLPERSVLSISPPTTRPPEVGSSRPQRGQNVPSIATPQVDSEQETLTFAEVSSALESIETAISAISEPDSAALVQANGTTDEEDSLSELHRQEQERFEAMMKKFQEEENRRQKVVPSASFHSAQIPSESTSHPAHAALSQNGISLSLPPSFSPTASEDSSRSEHTVESLVSSTVMSDNISKSLSSSSISSLSSSPPAQSLQGPDDFIPSHSKQTSLASESSFGEGVRLSGSSTSSLSSSPPSPYASIGSFTAVMEQGLQAAHATTVPEPEGLPSQSSSSPPSSFSSKPSSQQPISAALPSSENTKAAEYHKKSATFAGFPATSTGSFRANKYKDLLESLGTSEQDANSPVLSNRALPPRSMSTMVSASTSSLPSPSFLPGSSTPFTVSSNASRSSSDLRSSETLMQKKEAVPPSQATAPRKQKKKEGLASSFKENRRLSFTVHTKLAPADQNNLCWGCKEDISAGWLSSPRYCEYMGKYYCKNCHSGEKAIIPARVLQDWDFRPYPVCDLSKLFLGTIHFDAILNVKIVNPQLYVTVPELKTIKLIRYQLRYMRDFILTCRNKDEVTSRLSQHHVRFLKDDPDLYCMADLVAANSKELLPAVKKIWDLLAGHLDKCLLCQAKGSLCEFCGDSKPIFPFNLKTVVQCPSCHAFAHRRCYTPQTCPRCARKRASEYRDKAGTPPVQEKSSHIATTATLSSSQAPSALSASSPSFSSMPPSPPLTSSSNHARARETALTVAEEATASSPPFAQPSPLTAPRSVASQDSASRARSSSASLGHSGQSSSSSSSSAKLPHDAVAPGHVRAASMRDDSTANSRAPTLARSSSALGAVTRPSPSLQQAPAPTARVPPQTSYSSSPFIPQVRSGVGAFSFPEAAAQVKKTKRSDEFL